MLDQRTRSSKPIMMEGSINSSVCQSTEQASEAVHTEACEQRQKIERQREVGLARACPGVVRMPC